MMKLRRAFVLSIVLAGCTSYVTPGGPASIPAMTDADVAEALSRQPAAQFPVRLAIARVQASGYASATSEGYGAGRYSVVTQRDIETEADFQRFAGLAGVAGVAPLGRILLPSSLQSARELRTAAAQLRADMVFVYTLDTSFRTDTTTIGPLQVISLGLFPNRKARVSATCSGAFIDVRTGYVYGTVEKTAVREQRSDVWGTREAIDKARREAEREAFLAMLGEIESFWPSLLGTK
ncbi:MAG: hypothetical protein U1F72_04030 [Gammaproteobacteria bacterium]